jgi:hypothetical protein
VVHRKTLQSITISPHLQVDQQLEDLQGGFKLYNTTLITDRAWGTLVDENKNLPSPLGSFCDALLNPKWGVRKSRKSTTDGEAIDVISHQGMLTPPEAGLSYDMLCKATSGCDTEWKEKVPTFKAKCLWTQAAQQEAQEHKWQWDDESWNHVRDLVCASKVAGVFSNRAEGLDRGSYMHMDTMWPVQVLMAAAACDKGMPDRIEYDSPELVDAVGALIPRYDGDTSGKLWLAFPAFDVAEHDARCLKANVRAWIKWRLQKRNELHLSNEQIEYHEDLLRERVVQPFQQKFCLGRTCVADLRRIEELEILPTAALRWLPSGGQYFIPKGVFHLVINVGAPLSWAVEVLC